MDEIQVKVLNTKVSNGFSARFLDIFNLIKENFGDDVKVFSLNCFHDLFEGLADSLFILVSACAIVESVSLVFAAGYKTFRVVNAPCSQAKSRNLSTVVKFDFCIELVCVFHFLKI